MPEVDASIAAELAIAEIHDLSLDIERWDLDAEFADDDGGVIHYVFDQNIFELFTFPFENCDQFDLLPPSDNGRDRSPRQTTFAS